MVLLQRRRCDGISAFKLYCMRNEFKLKSITHKGLMLLCVFALSWSACAKKPVSDAVEVALPTAALTPEPTLPPTFEPTPFPTREPDALSAGEGVYTIAWLSDTQHYSKKYPGAYFAMTHFLSSERERLKLAYIVHTGDLVHNYNKEEQWQIADEAQRLIDDIPNGVCAGNHDVHYKDANYKFFSRYFGAQRYEGKAWYGANYRDNRGHYDLIDAGSSSYIFVYMGYGVDSSCIKWINAVLAEHRDRIGVLCTHDYFKTDLERSDTGEELFNKVVKENPNLYMVMCGHRYNEACVPASFDDDGDGQDERTVYQIINNYQAASRGGSGYMRFLQVDEARGEIRVFSYSPATGDYNYYDEPETQNEKYAADPAGEEYVLRIPWSVQK